MSRHVICIPNVYVLGPLYCACHYLHTLCCGLTQVRDAASQLEFLKEVGTAGVGSLQAPDLLYLQGLLAWKQGQDLFQVLLHHTMRLVEWACLCTSVSCCANTTG